MLFRAPGSRHLHSNLSSLYGLCGPLGAGPQTLSLTFLVIGSHQSLCMHPPALQSALGLSEGLEVSVELPQDWAWDKTGCLDS